ncbi:MAG: peptide deformylase [Acidimicrobiia bacterium]|nr:MAG: peptide deformylase [Acidimicrobiia bacterium]
MTIRAIPQIGDPVLRTVTTDVKAEELTSVVVQTLIDDMIETMADAMGAGIAATQVGESLSICIVGVERNERYPYKPPIPLTVLVNPVVRPIDCVTFLNNEGCLSVPIRGDLYRFMNIEVTALDRRGAESTTVYRGLSAGTVQHEVDHLAGTLIVDRMHDARTISTWENFQEHGMADYVERIRPVIDATEPRAP